MINNKIKMINKKIKMINKRIGLYIHIPFCKSKCNYCDFNSFAGQEGKFNNYFDALKHEIVYYSDILKEHTIESVFIGGGTPSLAEPSHINALMNTCRQAFCIADNAEITIESNPGTLSYEKLSSYRNDGINRLSIGLQAFHDKHLVALGRIHSGSDYFENLAAAIKAGFRNINTDLIFGFPGQSMEDWTETLHEVIRPEIQHVSCYSLKIEEGTAFGCRLEEGKLEMPEDELDRDLYRYAVEYLGMKGFKHYEISNFAREGYECRHNLRYWKAEEYLGVGAGAHSYLEGKRFNNIYDIDGYIYAKTEAGGCRENVQIIDKTESMAEFMILGLRLTKGISIKEFGIRYEENIFKVYGRQLDRLLERNLIECLHERIYLTDSGLDLANDVFVEFIN